MAKSCERIYLNLDGECWIAQFAVGGRPCIPFYVHKQTVEKFTSDEEFFAYLERMAESMMEMYGPADRSIN